MKGSKSWMCLWSAQPMTNEACYHLVDEPSIAIRGLGEIFYIVNVFSDGMLIKTVQDDICQDIVIFIIII